MLPFYVQQDCNPMNSFKFNTIKSNKDYLIHLKKTIGLKP